MTRLRRGSAAVEFAFCFPVLSIMVAGIVDVGSFMSLAHRVSRAAREGARVGSMVIEGSEPTGDVIEAASVEQARVVLEAAGIACVAASCDVTAEWEDVGGIRMVTVRVEYPYDAPVGMFPFIPDIAADTFTMMTQQQ